MISRLLPRPALEHFPVHPSDASAVASRHSSRALNPRAGRSHNALPTQLCVLMIENEPLTSALGCNSYEFGRSRLNRISSFRDGAATLSSTAEKEGVVIEGNGVFPELRSIHSLRSGPVVGLPGTNTEKLPENLLSVVTRSYSRRWPRWMSDSDVLGSVAAGLGSAGSPSPIHMRYPAVAAPFVTAGIRISH